MTALSRKARVALLMGAFALMAGVLIWCGPIAQDPAYHNFADRRAWLGVSNFGDVASNAAFTIAGLHGFYALWRLEGEHALANNRVTWPFLAFFLFVILISAGSAWYHLAPDNDRLFWDRLPIAIALTAWFAGMIADRIDMRFGVFICLPLFMTFGAFGTIYWITTENAGAGDLRLYALAQFFPLLALPLLCWLFPKARYTGHGYLPWVYFWFCASKALEHFDGQVFTQAADTVSGHSLKHLALALAVLVTVRMIENNARKAG